MSLTNMRRHGWQPPLHPLQIVAMTVFSFLVVSFYVFLWPFLGNRVVKNTIITTFSFAATSVIVLFIRCTAIDPSDRTGVKKKRRVKTGKLLQLNYKFMFAQIIVRFFRKMENRILKCFIRRKYLDTMGANVQFEPLLPFPLVSMEEAVAPHLKDDDISFCSICDTEVKMHSKHCRSCNKCVEGFDHHCKWLNNCIGKRNYTTFILMMIFVLLMLIIEGGTAMTIFVLCFADKARITHDLHNKLHKGFPTGVLATIAILLASIAAYSSAALGQLFFFHVVLIKKGMRTYDYILAMREEIDLSDPFDESETSSSDESVDFDTPEKHSSFSHFLCHGFPASNQSQRRLSIRIEREPNVHVSSKKPSFSINPWKLLKMSKEKALLAVEKARENIVRQRQLPLRPLPLELKHGPLENSVKKEAGGATVIESTSIVSHSWFPGSPIGRFSSPRRRFSGSPSPRPQKYRNNFDLKLTQVSRELETHISRQVLSSVLMKESDDEGCSTN